MSVFNFQELIKKLTDIIEIVNEKELLLWKRCVFMTFDQYTKKEHINEKVYYHEGITKDVEKYVIEHIKDLSGKLPFKRVPLPIYVLYAKKLEYDVANSNLPATCKKAYTDLDSGKLDYEEMKKTYEAETKSKFRQYKKIYDEENKNYVKDFDTYTDYDVSCFLDKDKNLIDKNSEDIKKYKFIYDQLGSQENIEYLKKSSLAAYKFKGRYEVIIYIPNLTNDLKYFSSFYDFSYQNRWMDIITNKNSKYFAIIPFKKEYKKSIIQAIGRKRYENNKKKYDELIQSLNDKDSREYPFIKDMTYVCYDKGCVSEYGEDLEEIVPAVATSYDQQLNNATGKAPYFPTKCLRTDYYKEHMIKFDEKDYKKRIKEQLIKDVEVFQENHKQLLQGKEPETYSSLNMIDLIKGTAAKFRNENYKEGTGDAEYSKEYNRKILSELAFRHNSYPGVQEISFPAFVINKQYTEIQDYVHLMPWGHILLTKEYVLNDGDVLYIDETPLKSFNSLYEVKFDENGILSLFFKGIKVKPVIQESFKAYTKRSLLIQNGSLNVYGYFEDNNDSRYTKIIVTANSISPVSIIVENNGDINIYENGFNKIGALLE